MGILYIIGHARSGTTVLNSALNVSPNIHILGEANFYLNGELSGFRRRFNATHEEWGNQPTKTCYAPLLPDLSPYATGNEYLEAMSKNFQYGGEKLALGPPGSGHDIEALKDALEMQRHDATLLWVMREPRAVLQSCVSMFGFEVRDVVASLTDTLLLFLHNARTLPRVYILNHDTISKQDFVYLSKVLNVDLGDAVTFYVRHRRTPPPQWGANTPEAPLIDLLERAHHALMGEINKPRVAIPQNVLQAGQMLTTAENADSSHAIGNAYRWLHSIRLELSKSQMVKAIAAQDPSPSAIPILPEPEKEAAKPVQPMARRAPSKSTTGADLEQPEEQAEDGAEALPN